MTETMSSELAPLVANGQCACRWLTMLSLSVKDGNEFVQWAKGKGYSFTDESADFDPTKNIVLIAPLEPEAAAHVLSSASH